MPRKNMEKYSTQSQKEQLKLLCGDALLLLRKQLKSADANTLTRFIMQIWPMLLNDETQTQSDLSLELLAKKALKVQMRITDATAQQQVSEEIVDEEQT